MVLVITGHGQRGPQLTRRELCQCCGRRLRGAEFIGLLLVLFPPLLFAVARQVNARGRGLGEQARPDILAHHAPAYATATGVIQAAARPTFPRHPLCYTSLRAPLCGAAVA